jgi:uncharacterized membrane protein
MARHRGAFGDDPFGRRAEKLARFFGTPKYILSQTVIVIIWIAIESLAIAFRWDPYPFILLNLAFSTQAAYAAPLILLAQTRQADRDKEHSDILEKRHTKLEAVAEKRTRDILELLASNTTLTQQDKDMTAEVAKLTSEIHALLTQRSAPPAGV